MKAEGRRQKAERVTAATWLLLLLALLATLTSHGADLQRGINFTDGQRITAAQLHQLIDSGTIVPGFYLGKPSATSLAGTDTILIYNAAASAFYKISANTLLYGNAALITGQPEKTTPAAGDFVLIYDTSGTVLSKVQVGNLNSNLVSSLPLLQLSNLTATATIWVVNNGTNAQATVSNLFQLFDYTRTFTNLPPRTHPTNYDQLLLAASDDNTNFYARRISLENLFSNLPPAGPLSNSVADGTPTPTNLVFLVYQRYWTTNGFTNAIVGTADLLSLRNYFTNYFTVTNKTPVTFTSAEINLTNTLISITNIAHGLGHQPQFVRAVLVCKTNEVGYAAGDEIVMDTGVKDSSDNKYSAYGADGTNCFLAFLVAGRIQVPNKNTGSHTSLTGNSGAWVPNFRLKFYATYYPPP